MLFLDAVTERLSLVVIKYRTLPWHYPQVELLYGVGEGGKYHTDTYAFGLGTGLRVSGQFWLKNGHTH